MIFYRGRYWIPILYVVAMLLAPVVQAQNRTAAPLVTVYKTPT